MIGDTRIHLKRDTTAFFDSGTALIGGPSAEVHRVYAQIPGSRMMDNVTGHYTYPCHISPNVSFSFGQRNYVVSDSDFQAMVVEDHKNATSKQCLGALYALEGKINQGRWLMGAAFMKNVYTVMDGGERKRVGFARLKQVNNNGTLTGPAIRTSGAASLAPPTHALLFIGVAFFVLSHY